MPERPEFHTYPELRTHFNSVLDFILEDSERIKSQPEKKSRTILDVGSGNGSVLTAVVLGTDLRGIAVDLNRNLDWRGPPNFQFIQADSRFLPFRRNCFTTVVSSDSIESLAHPNTTLTGMARVTQGDMILVQTDWRSLWFNNEDSDTSQEFTRLFAGIESRASSSALVNIVEQVNLPIRSHVIHTIHGNKLTSDTYSGYLLKEMRDELVIKRAIIRASRFDKWYKSLVSCAKLEQFSFSIDRHVIIVNCHSI